jgi:hypothetical protein
MTMGTLSSDGTAIAFLPFSNSIGFDPDRTNQARLSVDGSSFFHEAVQGRHHPGDGGVLDAALDGRDTPAGRSLSVRP